MKSANPKLKPVSTRTLERRILRAAEFHGYWMHHCGRAPSGAAGLNAGANAKEEMLTLRMFLRELRRRAEGKEPTNV